MLEITFGQDNIVIIEGRFDASQVDLALTHFNEVKTSVTLHCEKLQYISSAGLGVLVSVQKRLMDSGHRMKLTQLSPHIREVLELAGFDAIFEIE